MGYNWHNNTSSGGGGKEKTTKRAVVKTNLLRLCIVAAISISACIPILHELSVDRLDIAADQVNFSVIPPTTTKLSVNVIADQANVTSLQRQKSPTKWPESPFFHAGLHHIPTYTEHLAKEAIKPSSWRCGAKNIDSGNVSNNRTIFAFVHIYKAAGTTVRQFFYELAYACHKTWLSIATCTDVRPSSIKSRGNWEPCQVEEVADGRNQKPRISNKGTSREMSSDAIEKFVDIYGGHVRIGTGDYLFSSSPTPSNRVRHVIFLRDPIERYVSGVLYQNKVYGRNETLDQVSSKVKRWVASKRRKDQYWDKSLSYLLTPTQRVQNKKMNVDKLRKLLVNTTVPFNSAFLAEARSKLAIRNMHQYNAIIGFTERMAESLLILKHVLLHRPDEGLGG